jgi:hypothetical protein
MNERFITPFDSKNISSRMEYIYQIKHISMHRASLVGPSSATRINSRTDVEPMNTQNIAQQKQIHLKTLAKHPYARGGKPKY